MEEIVFNRILKQMREKIRTCQYVMTLHAEEEMSDDDLTVFDVEHAILIGKIVERQKDHKTGEWKYLVKGKTISQGVKLLLWPSWSPTDKLVIITVYGK